MSRTADRRSNDADGDSPLVSCIMPTRGRRAFVARALDYFRRQDWPNLELVVVDDGLDAVEDLTGADPRIRYHGLRGRHTIGHKRNLACELACGSLIAHWDDDDWYPPWRLRRQVEALHQAGADVCGSSRLYFWEPATDRAWHYHYQGSDPVLVGTTLLYRKPAWARTRFPDIQIGEDVRFLASLRGARHDLLEPSISVGLVHSGNTSRKQTAGRYWTAVASAEVHRLLGADTDEYRGGALPP